MQFSSYLPIILLFIVLYVMRNNQKAIITRRVIEKRKREDNTEMIELAKRFIGKECIIYAFDSSHQFEGIIREVTDGAILIEKEEKLEAVNLDFVIRIREYPRNKKGEKKTLVLD